jgi:hypothetical protein
MQERSRRGEPIRDEANADTPLRRDGTYCKDAVAFSIFTIHLNVIIAPFFEKVDHKTSLYKPRKHGVQCEYHLTLDMRRILDQNTVDRAYSKAYASRHGRIAVARLAEHRCYRFKKPEVRN